MTRGRAAKVALDPRLLVEFIDLHTTYRSDGIPKRRRRYLNGVCLDPDTDARIIRRWRNTAAGVTPQAAERLLGRCNITLADFFTHARLSNRNAYLRGPA